MTAHAQVIIIGGGPAGYTAALYAARAGLSPVCFEGFDTGGQISRSGRVDNYPGLQSVTGADLSAKIRNQAEAAGATIEFGDVFEVNLDAAPYRVAGLDGERTADAVIIATGAAARKLGLPSEEALEGSGVAYCAICDGPFFAGKKVVVIGGGDAAVGEALALQHIAGDVTLVHRRNEFRASGVMRAALASSGIEVITPAVVEEILGVESGAVTGVRIRRVDDGSVHDLDAEGVFVSIGHEPASQLFQPWLDCDEHGFLITERGTTATSVPGVFAAGDVADSRYRQAVTAAASGCQAAIDAERYLLGRRFLAPQTLESAAG
ncbi:thioredoxin reductase [Actinoplanes sp. NBRC 14428]|nr:thioredoxin reductase [Actinoplanes sp. NBRC 14428]